MYELERTGPPLVALPNQESTNPSNRIRRESLNSFARLPTRSPPPFMILPSFLSPTASLLSVLFVCCVLFRSTFFLYFRLLEETLPQAVL